MLPAPTLTRRLAALLYEGVILFGVVMVAGYLYTGLTHQQHALAGRAGLQAFMFLVLGIYFVWFWSHGGQTVAMKAWHIRLLDLAGRPVTQARAFARYLLAWMWFAPALLGLATAGLRSGLAVAAALVAGASAYAALTQFRADRQFLHDVICGTRLVDSRPAA
jgi:uncharacterized RDD family membrane protein YckC